MSNRDMEKLPRENVYVCPQRHLTVTVDVDMGVTSMFIDCRESGCKKTATSSMYPKKPRPPHIPAPAWEWYRPTEKEAKKKDRRYPGTLDHVQRGGLLIRPRTDREPVYHEAKP